MYPVPQERKSRPRQSDATHITSAKRSAGTQVEKIGKVAGLKTYINVDFRSRGWEKEGAGKIEKIADVLHSAPKVKTVYLFHPFRDIRSGISARERVSFNFKGANEVLRFFWKPYKRNEERLFRLGGISIIKVSFFVYLEGFRKFRIIGILPGG